jgi:peptidyl-tRNA hydrolase
MVQADSCGFENCHCANGVPLLFAGAQCAHAAIGVVLQLLAADVLLYQHWEQCSQRKIVVKVQDAQCLVRCPPKYNSSTICCTDT